MSIFRDPRGRNGLAVTRNGGWSWWPGSISSAFAISALAPLGAHHD
jgi:hypothetical protein